MLGGGEGSGDWEARRVDLGERDVGVGEESEEAA